MQAVKGLGEVSQDEYARSRMLEDLQLAAELGKTLLERNKELEASLKQHQNIIEDQTQEIEYLTKQTVALREVNDSRLRIYEQLEVSIQDLERANHRLVLENQAEKKHVKSLNVTIESLEAKCEDLQGTIDDLRIQVDILKKKSVRPSDPTPIKSTVSREYIAPRHVPTNKGEFDSTRQLVSPDSSAGNLPSPIGKQPESTKSSSQAPSSRSETDCGTTTVRTALWRPECDQDHANDESDSSTEQMLQVLAQLRESRAQSSKHERIIAELEEQLATMVSQNQALENQVVQLSHRGDDLNMKSMHEELNTLDEVRQGQMCSRCLRSCEQAGSEIPDDDDSSMMRELLAADADDASVAQHHRTSFTLNVQDNQSTPKEAKPASNPYRELVEKYEALVEVHRKPTRCSKSEGVSLHEEMQMSGDFHTISTKDTDEESGHGGSVKAEKKIRKTFSTPTDFSEAETSSSGFADETSNKGTQTEGRVGSFLCTIADGEDCKFSIYDDASPFDSRFRDRPEYRDLFKEIFKVLKKAAENKEEGEDLPLLDDNAITKLTPKVPPVTPSNDQLPDFPDDDTQSIMSSTMSELSISQNEPTTVVENIIESQNNAIPEPSKSENILRPLVRQPLEFISVEVRKRSSSRRKNKYSDRSDSPVTHIIGSPKITYSSRPNSGRRRKELRLNTSGEPEPTENPWNGNTLQFWSTTRNVASPTPSQGSGKYIEFKPSTASQELGKLKKLEKSYAEVLRECKKRENRQQRKK